MPDSAIDTPVTAEELAAVITAYDNGKPCADPDAEKRRREIQARRVLARLNDRRITDAQRHAIQRLESAAREIADDAGAAVDEALAELHGLERSDSGRAAILALIQRLDDDGHVDLIAGTSPIENALRRYRQEAQRA